jgi:hypothetical protein
MLSKCPEVSRRSNPWSNLVPRAFARFRSSGLKYLKTWSSLGNTSSSSCLTETAPLALYELYWNNSLLRTLHVAPNKLIVLLPLQRTPWTYCVDENYKQKNINMSFKRQWKSSNKQAEELPRSSRTRAGHRAFLSSTRKVHTVFSACRQSERECHERKIASKHTREVLHHRMKLLKHADISDFV